MPVALIAEFEVPAKDFFDAIAGIDVRWTTRHGEALG